MKKRKATPNLLWAYCRVSTQKDEQELSLEEQIRWVREFAALRGARLVVFQERASAKTIIGRSECAGLLRALEIGDDELPEMLLASSFDRLSRDMTDTLMLARALRVSGVELYIRDRGIIPMDSFADQAALVGQAMGGHAENEARSTRAKASWARRRREGKPTSNKSPYGLILRGERDTPHPETAQWVRFAFEWYAGGQGMHSIAKRLKEQAPAHRILASRPSRDGAPIERVEKPVWEYNRVRKMFGQARYRGVVVPDELFDRVQELIASKPHWKQERVHEYPLSGAIKCASCGRSFHGHATGGNTTQRLRNGEIRRYPGRRRVRYYGCTVCHYMVNAEIFESRFRADLDKLTADPKLIGAWVQQEKSATTAALRDEMIALRKKIDSDSFNLRRQRAWELALSDTIVGADLPRLLRTISDEEAQCRARLHELQALESATVLHQRREETARQLIENFWPVYDAAKYEEKRELCATLVRVLGGAVATKHELIWLNKGGHKVANSLAKHPTQS